MGTTITDSSLSFSEWMLIVQAVILFLGLGFTAFSIRSNKMDNKRMATIDLILRQRNNEKLDSAIDLVSELVAKNEFPTLNKYLDKKNFPNERKAILTLLNYREFVAAGINTGIIDEEIYQRCYHNIVLRDWKNLHDTVHAIRKSPKGSETNFKEFEMLINRWESQKFK